MSRRLLRLAFMAASVIAVLAVGMPQAYALSQCVGALDQITVIPDGMIRVRGWALTSDYPTTPLGIRVLIDGQPSLITYRLANEYRPDVGAAFPGYGDYHGFEFHVPAPSGTHTVRIEAQNSGVYNVIGAQSSYSMAPFQAGGLRRFSGGSFTYNPGVLLFLPYWRANNTYDWQVDNATVAWEATDSLCRCRE